MVFPVVGGNESKGYEISNSLRLDSASTANLTRTPSSAGNRRTYTLSTWIKRGKLDATEDHIISAGASNDDSIFFNSSHQFRFIWDISSGTEKQLVSNRVFRDPSAWYHLVVIVDTTQSTASDRIKLYVNGIQETSFGTDNRSDLTQNYDMNFNNTVAHRIGDRNEFASNANNSFDGYLSEFHWVDGTAKAHTDFGEFNDNGVWIPKKYTGTYGTNGFYLQFKQTGTSANASGIGADTSGNTHHWTPGNLGATDVTEDTCTNNFATLSPILTDTTRTTFSEGNCKNVNTNASTAGTTIAVDKGKWYCEMICTAKTAVNAVIGICTVDGFDGERQIDESQNGGSGHGYVMNATKVPGGASYGATWAVDDIMGIALDLDSAQNTITFYKNNSSQGSIDIDNKLYVFANCNGQGSDTTITYSNNFGNPPHSISSGNTDENGYGNFEYAPPSGYYALCTKNLAEFG